MMGRTARDGQSVAEVSVLRNRQTDSQNSLGPPHKAMRHNLSLPLSQLHLPRILPAFVPSSPETCLSRQGSKIRARPARLSIWGYLGDRLHPAAGARDKIRDHPSDGAASLPAQPERQDTDCRAVLDFAMQPLQATVVYLAHGN